MFDLIDVEKHIKEGVSKAYRENLFLTGNYTDFQTRIIESLIVINIAQHLLVWGLKNYHQIQLEYPIRDFYNGAFPNFIWGIKDSKTNRFIQRGNYNPSNNVKGRMDIVITREPNNKKDGEYIDPKLQSIVGIEVKSINKSKSDIKKDVLRLSNALALKDKLTENSIKAGYSVFLQRLDNSKKITGNDEIDNKIKKENKYWGKYINGLKNDYLTLSFEILNLDIVGTSFDDVKQYYSPEHFYYDEVAEETGYVISKIIKITQK